MAPVDLISDQQFRYSRTRIGKRWLLVLILLLLLWFMFASHGRDTRLVLGLLVTNFVLFSAVTLKKVLSRDIQLSIGSTGMQDHRLPFGPLLWSDIRVIHLKRASVMRLILIGLTDRERGETRLSAYQRFVCWCYSDDQRYDLYVDASDIEISDTELQLLVEGQNQLHGSKSIRV